MNKSVMYYIAFLMAVFSVFASDNYVLSYNNVKEEHKVYIEECIRSIFPHQLITANVNPLFGGLSGDDLYVIETKSCKCVFRCMKQPHSIDSFSKDCMYLHMASEKELGPKVLYQNREKGCYATEFVEGVHLSSVHLEDKFILERFACALSSIHNTSIDSRVKFDIFACMEQKIENNKQKNPKFSIELTFSLDELHKIKTVVKKHNIEPKTCHNDIHMMNLFYTSENNINFIDWGNAGLGDPFWDLVCSSIKLHFSKDQRDYFLEKYFKNDYSPLDRAHFILMENIVLLEVWLYYLSMKQAIPNESVKETVCNYFRKINEKVGRTINTFEDLAAICFDLIKKRIQSQEYKESFSLLDSI